MNNLLCGLLEIVPLMQKHILLYGEPWSVKVCQVLGSRSLFHMDMDKVIISVALQKKF